jgi:hypothetical protein
MAAEGLLVRQAARSVRPEFVSAAVSELLKAAEPFASLCDPCQAPDDGYEQVGPCRVTFGQIRRLRKAIDALRDEWRA